MFMISLTPESLDRIEEMARINGRALSIWLRAMLVILSRGNRMAMAELMRMLCGHNVPKREVCDILEQSQCFAYDEKREFIWCTEQALEWYSVKDQKEKNPSGPKNKEEIPSGVAHVGTLPTVGNNKYNNSKKRELKLSKRKSIAELCSSAPSPAEKEFYEQMMVNFPRICQMEEPLTYQEFQRLVADGIPIVSIREVLSDMENHKVLLMKYVSANLTVRKWLRRGGERAKCNV